MEKKIEAIMGIILGIVLAMFIITIYPSFCMGIFVSCVIVAVYEGIQAARAKNSKDE